MHSLIMLPRMVVAVLLFLAFVLPARADLQLPIINKNFSVASSSSGLADPVFTGMAAAAGNLTIEFVPVTPDNHTCVELLQPVDVTTLHVTAGDTVRTTARVRILRDGYFIIASVRIHFIPDVTSEDEWIRDELIPCHADVHGLHVTHYSIEIDPSMTAEPTSVSGPINTLKGNVKMLGSDQESKQSDDEGNRFTSAQTMTIHLFGRVIYTDPVSGVVRSVQGLKVYLNWDDDDDPAVTRVPPYNYVAPSVTNMNGEYSFWFSFQADHPASFYADRIRLSVSRCNDAAAPAPGGCPMFPVLNNSSTISLAGLQYLIENTNLNINLTDVDDAGALRHLLRARQATTDGFGHTPQQILYIIDHNNAHSYFSTGDWWGGRDYRHILFNRYPGADVAYHEYGHYVEVSVVGSQMNGGCPVHTFRQQSNQACAWNEGWGEGFAAIVHFFWYAREWPARAYNDVYGIDGFTDPPQTSPIYQFLDYSMGELRGSTNGTQTEGSLATFFYSLWDDIPGRYPGYNGDNDDLGWISGHSANMILMNLRNRNRRGDYTPAFNYLWLGIMPSAKQSFPKTWPYHTLSMYALYRYVMDHVSVPRPATPNSLNIVPISRGLGRQPWRKLNWLDVTEPATLTVTEEGGAAINYNLFENDEDGYDIWRLKMRPNAPWPLPSDNPWDGRDGRLDPRYVRIATVGRNVTTYIDADFLSPGQYRYVVVAYNKNNPDSAAIPKAEATFTIGGNITIKDDDSHAKVGTLPTGGTKYLMATSDSIRVSPTYHWLIYNKPSFMEIHGIDSQYISITNHYSSTYQGMPDARIPGFYLRCVMTDSSGSDTSSSYYPLYVPLDVASRIVRVEGGSGLIPDTTLLHGLQFATTPGVPILAMQQLSVNPIKSNGIYHLQLRGFTQGLGYYNRAKLYAIDHPSGTELRGSAEEGYTIYAHKVDSLGHDSLVVDSNNYAYGMEELPLVSAIHNSFGEVGPMLRSCDSLIVPIDSSGSISLSYADFDFVDSTRIGWQRNFVLELECAYSNTTGSATASGLVASAGEATVADFVLDQNTPNPFSSTTTIGYTLNHDGFTTLKLVDLNGTPIRTLVDQFQQAGRHTATVNLSGLPSGTYYYSLSMAGRSLVRSLVVMH